jgi:hypothetical protein
LRGGRRGALLEAEVGGFDATEADVLGVVTDSAPGEGVEDSALIAEGDSEDMLSEVCAQLFSTNVTCSKVWWQVCRETIANVKGPRARRM